MPAALAGMAERTRARSGGQLSAPFATIRSMEAAPSQPGSPREVPTREGYDQWAASYDKDANPLVILEEGHVAAILGEVRGQSIADIGCGTGRHALRLARAGAEATALDFSEEMLARARAKPGAERVRFVQPGLCRPLPLPDASYARVLCCLVLDHIRKLDLLFSDLRRVCNAGGFVLVTAMPPAMLIKGVQARFPD